MTTLCEKLWKPQIEEERLTKCLIPVMGEPDINESLIRSCDENVLATLLIDRTMTAFNCATTNIKWAVDDYKEKGEGFFAEDTITLDAISSADGTDLKIITPRVKKRVLEQVRRSKEKAEVFTPSWVCNAQNNLVDAAWFSYKKSKPRKKSPFNDEIAPLELFTKVGFASDRRWTTTEGKIKFAKDLKKTWQDYVSALRLEVSCGEAPYLTSRYDTTDGLWIKPKNRIGLLDRKLRIVRENCADDSAQWLVWAEVALQSCYGFEWQGDSVILARENMLFAVLEAYYDHFGTDTPIPTATVRRFAEIISWNIWQMDGIKFVVPNTCGKHVDLLDNPAPCPGCAKNDPAIHDGNRCRVMDWQTGEPVWFMPPFDFAPIKESV